ncbi:MAG: MBL fold metallo-hydrolase [Firmicutes bacterium]|jgi:glyoxylase-like metal-dependent hydrolase (beta-lactamase superfamily II)|nr:MBL fold metallo-hydrolase [Bacillota bacterium]
MDLLRLSQSVYCFAGPTNVGVIVGPRGDAVLVDSGLDASTGKKLARRVTELGWRIAAVVNTHGHADHAGGDAEIRRRTGCMVLAPRFEEAWIREPLMEPLALFGGARPPAGLRNKFTMAEPCEVDGVIEPGLRDICGLSVRIEPLAGHSPNQVGVACEGVLFCGDAFFLPEQLSKHVVPYNVDIAAQLQSMERLLRSEWSVVVPGHGGVCPDPGAAVRVNAERVRQVADLVWECAAAGATAEQVVQSAASRLHLQIASEAHYYLFSSAVGAYLSYLESSGRLECDVVGPRLVWRAAEEARCE